MQDTLLYKVNPFLSFFLFCRHRATTVRGSNGIDHLEKLAKNNRLHRNIGMTRWNDDIFPFNISIPTAFYQAWSEYLIFKIMRVGVGCMRELPWQVDFVDLVNIKNLRDRFISSGK